MKVYHDNLDSENFYPEKLRLRQIDAPKTYTFIAPTYLINVPNPLSFLPHRQIKSFNDKVFFNSIHRECFNSCIDSENENQCYLNCQSKHLASIQLLKTAIEERRKYDPYNSYLNLREYHKRPEEQGVNIPSDNDFSYKLKWIYRNNTEGLTHNFKGLEEVFNHK